MPKYRVTAPDGRKFDITAPEGATQEEVLAYAQSNFPPATPVAQTPASPQAAPERPGLIGSFKESMETLGLADEAAVYAANPTIENRKKFLDAAKSKYESVGFGQGENWEAFKEMLGSSLGQMVAPMAAATAGSIATPFAGAAAGVSTIASQYGIQNLLRQAQEQERAAAEGKAPQDLSLGKAALATAGETALDVVQFKKFKALYEAFPLVRNLVGGGKGAKEATEAIVDAAKEGTLKTTKQGIVTGAAKGVAFEVPQEVAQQALERWQAGLSVTDADAMDEFKQAAIGAALLGPVMGGAEGYLDVRRERKAAEPTAETTQEDTETTAPPPPDTTETAPEPAEVSPEAIAAAKEYADQVASGKAKFNLFKGRALIRKLGYQIGNDSKFADTKAIFDSLVSGEPVDIPKAGTAAPAAPTTPAESVDLGMLTTGQFVPGGEAPSGAVTTTPVDETVDTTVGRGAVVPPSGVGTAEPSVAGPEGQGLETIVSPPNAPDVREGELSPALTGAEEAATPKYGTVGASDVSTPQTKPITTQGGVSTELKLGDAVRVGNMPGTIIDVEGDYVKFRPVNARSDKAYQRIPASMVTFESRPSDSLVSLSKKIEDQFGEETGRLEYSREDLIPLLGANMYGGNIADVAVKEMLQNSFDAVKESVAKNQYKSGNVEVAIDKNDRTIVVSDDGVGMTPDIIRKAFFTVGGSAKELSPEDTSGGLGLAKMGVLMGAERISIDTVRDGVRTKVDTGRNEIASGDFKIVKSPAPKGEHGTKITLKIPETYVDSKGDNKDIWFPWGSSAISIFDKPLIGPINVKFKDLTYDESKDLPIGINYDTEAMPKLTSAETDWGTLDIYMGVERKKYPKHNILSSGIWQFEQPFNLNRNEKIPYDIVVNVRPKVRAKSIDYPFENNREKFKKRVEPDINALQAYLQQIARGEEAKELQQGFKNVVSMPRSDIGGDLKETTQKLKKVFDRQRQGVSEGKISVPTLPKQVVISDGAVRDTSGKTIIEPPKTSDVTRESSFESKKAAPTAEEFQIVLEQDPKQPIFHNNTNVDYVEIGEPYGDPRQFFADLGTIIVEMKEALGNSGIYGYPRSYDVLKPENLFFAGISIDRGYGGVHLKSVPYKAIYLNPFYEWGADTLFGIRSNIYETITHELAHTGDMDHGVGHNTEMVKVRQYLADQGLEDYFRDSILKTLVKHESAFTAMKEAYGRATTKNTSKSLEDYNKDSSATSARGNTSGPKGAPRAVPTGGGQGRSGSVPAAGPSGGKRPVSGGVGKPTATGPIDNKGRTPAEAIKARQDTYKERFSKKSLVDRMLRYLNGKDSGPARLNKYEALVRKFQNDLRPALALERELKRAGELITFGPGMNDAYTKISAAQDKAAWLTSTRLKQPMDAAYKAIESYARSRNLTTDQAIEELDRFRIVLHEPERRLIMFMRYVPLSTKRRAFKASNGKTIQISPAEIRDSILKSLVTPGNDLVSNGQAKQLHNVLKALVSDPANLDPLGASPIKKEGKPLSTDINDDQYSVLAGYSPAFIKQWGDSFNALGRDKAGADAAIKAIEKIQDVTKELNRMGGYWSKPVDNIVEFYNFAHYTPFKGVPGTRVRAEAEMTDPNDVRISGEFADADQAMEGRETEADNSVLQSFSDALYAASRAGRAGVTEAVKNLIEQGHISGKKIAEITHEQRWLDKDFNLRQYKGRNKLFHYNEDGNIEVYQIANKDLGFLESIRRPYQVDNWTTKMANSITGIMGQLHTRFNPSFAPLNFPRDVFTNTMAISADVGGKEAMSYLSDALFHNVMKGGLQKSAKVSKLLSEGNIEELRRLAKDNPFYADTLELLEEGGRTAYKQATTLQAQADALEDMLAPNGVVKSGKAGFEAIGKWADMYNDAFEFTNRVAAYGVMKNNISARLKKEFREKNRREPNAQELAQINKAARTEGAAFSKNLANFRLVGTAGRQAGGLFMFFRASATGAVRAIDSLMPAFVDEKTALSQAPASIRDNPQAVQKYLKNYRENKSRAQWTMFTVAAAGAALYTMALVGSGDDDQGRNKVATDDMARWTRYARLPILGKNTVLQIPWGFGISAFGALGAQVAALASGNQSAKEMAANTINIAFDSFIPLPKSNINIFDNFTGFLVDSVTPTMLRPFVEFAMNTDNLGNEIYNSRQSKYSDAFTGGTNVPELYKDISKGLLESTGLDISPNSLYFWMSNYADSLSRVATSAYDVRLFASGDRELRSVDDLDRVLLPFDSFIGTKSNYDGRQYEAVKNQIEDKRRVIKSLESRPEAFKKYVDDHPTDLELVDFYNNAVNGELKYLQENSNQIKTSRQLSSQQKRDMLKENTRMQNLVKRNLIDTFKMYGVEP